MTIVVWDGKQLAVDTAAVTGNVMHHVNKCIIHGHFAVTYHGDTANGQQLVEWFITGRDGGAFPHNALYGAQRAELITVDVSNGLCKWECPTAIPFGQNKCAFGSGSEVAYGALYMGATAEQAAFAACEYNLYCSPPIDVYSFDAKAANPITHERKSHAN